MIPILLSLLFGILCTVIISTSSIKLYRVTPLPENIFGSFGNAFYFVILVGAGASLLYFLLRQSHKIMRLLIGFAITTAVFMLSLIYLFAVFSRFSIPQLEALVLIFSLLITVLVDFTVFRTQSRAYNLIVLCLGGALGAFLGASIPTMSAILILCFLAVYDTLAVYRGPLGKIAHSGLDKLRGLSFSYMDVQMGLGDLTFYSMLIGRTFSDAGPLLCLASTTGILTGVFLAFKMLERKGMFPGLPFPITLGLAPLIVSLFLQ